MMTCPRETNVLHSIPINFGMYCNKGFTAILASSWDESRMVQLVHMLVKAYLLKKATMKSW